MNRILIIILTLLLPVLLWSQKEYHVFTKDHNRTPGSSNGTGSLEHPWDLHTALSRSSNEVNGGDTIWIHGGIYNGRYVSTLQSTTSQKILVSAFNSEKVIINGNVTSNNEAVLEVRGGKVVFRDLEITFQGEFNRDMKISNFKPIAGINHVSGIECEFINLKIHNIPGSGIGSWKRTGGTTIEDCLIFNNGYFSKVRGSGVGIYVQNESDKIRLIKNNIIFNNYYKGIEVWSASRNAKDEFVKNITLDNNVVFNNGLAAGQFKDNIIVATDDNNGINVARNVKIINNVLYHNTDVSSQQIGGDAASLTLGYNARAPITNVTVTNNIIIGRNNALRLNNAKSLLFNNNITYCGYVHFNPSVLENVKSWNFENNSYYTKRNVPFRISKHKDYNLKEWKSTFNIDSKSRWNHLKDFDLPKTLKLIPRSDSKYFISLFNKHGKDVSVDFSEYNLAVDSYYSIKNIETEEIISSGKLDETKTVDFPMGTYNKTEDNFGVYMIEFESELETNQRESFFKRLFKWMF